ncbi:hypothetical protein PCE1_002736 [Barthelona sp. PCE]
MESVQKYSYAMVCSSNMNRSMAAHKILISADEQFDCRSYGTGDVVRLPHRNPRQTNDFKFNVAYQTMHDKLSESNHRVYTEMGVLGMLERNASIKSHPERFTDLSNHVDFIICFQPKVFDQVLEDLRRKGIVHGGKMSYVINFDTIDSLDNAEQSAKYVYEFVKKLEGLNDLSELSEVIEDFQLNIPIEMMWTVTIV